MPDRNCGMCGVGGPVGDALKVVTDPLEKVTEAGMEYGKKGMDMAKEGASKGLDLATTGVSAVSDVTAKGVNVVAGPVSSAMDATVMKVPGMDVVAEKTKEATNMAMDATGKVGGMALDGTKAVGTFAVDGATNGIKTVGDVSGSLMGGVEETFSKLGAAAGFQSIFGADIDKSDEGLEKAFKDVDTDGSGKISEDEMKAAIEKMYGKALDDKVLKEMMAAADTNNDGEIDVRRGCTLRSHRRTHTCTCTYTYTYDMLSARTLLRGGHVRYPRTIAPAHTWRRNQRRNAAATSAAEPTRDTPFSGHVQYRT